MTTPHHNIEIVTTVGRVAAIINKRLPELLAARTQGDAEVDLPPQWFVHQHFPWETGYAARSDVPGIFVHCAHRTLVLLEDKAVRGGPDLQVGFYIRCHQDRVASAARLGAYVSECLWSIAVENGYSPHAHSLSSFGRAESPSEFGVTGTVLFGLIDGAPGGWPQT